MKKLLFIPFLALLTGITFTFNNNADAHERYDTRHVDDYRDDRDDRYDRDDEWDDDDRYDRDDYYDDRDYDRDDGDDRDDRYDDDARRSHRWNRGHGKVEHRIPPGHRVKTHIRYRGDDHDRYDRRRVGQKYRYDNERYDNRRLRNSRHRIYRHDQIRANHPDGFPFPGLNLIYDSYRY